MSLQEPTNKVNIEQTVLITYTNCLYVFKLNQTE